MSIGLAVIGAAVGGLTAKKGAPVLPRAAIGGAAGLVLGALLSRKPKKNGKK